MGLLYDTSCDLSYDSARSSHATGVRAIRSSLQHRATAMIRIERGVSSNLSRLRDAYGTSLFGTVPKRLAVSGGVHLKLEQVDGKWWCGFEPYTFVSCPAR